MLTNAETRKQTNILDDRINSLNLKGEISKSKLFSKCYADRENSVAINYNGDVYNCTARDFNPKNREGYLNKDGEIIYNEKHQQRMVARYSNHNCLKCNIFPICNICSQKKLEQQNKNLPCIRMINEDEKERILCAKIQMLINGNSIKSTQKYKPVDTDKSSNMQMFK